MERRRETKGRRGRDGPTEVGQLLIGAEERKEKEKVSSKKRGHDPPFRLLRL
jgi:hypothetical protein